MEEIMWSKVQRWIINGFTMSCFCSHLHRAPYCIEHLYLNLGNMINNREKISTQKKWFITCHTAFQACPLLLLLRAITKNLPSQKCQFYLYWSRNYLLCCLLFKLSICVNQKEENKPSQNWCISNIANERLEWRQRE